jgi:cytoskeletal protein CcmA (bactofilin family)
MSNGDVDADMKVENGKIRGDHELRGNLRLKGMCTGTITVFEGARLMLDGTCKKLRILDGGEAVVHGTVANTVRNTGGDVEIYGKARHIDTTSGNTYIDQDAEVDGVVYDERSDVPRWTTLKDGTEYEAIRTSIDAGIEGEELYDTIQERFGGTRKEAKIIAEVAKGERTVASAVEALGGSTPDNE